MQKRYRSSTKIADITAASSYTVQLNKAVDNFRTKYILSTAFLKKTNCTFFSYSRNPGYAQL